MSSYKIMSYQITRWHFDICFVGQELEISVKSPIKYD
jgi:hypothetical protein